MDHIKLEGGGGAHHPLTPWAITFTSEKANEISGVPLGIGLHPTQLYESAAELLIFGILLTLHLKRPSFAGRTFLHYVLLYGVFRFFNEWPDWLERPIWPVMQAGALAVVPTSALGAWLVWRRARLAAGLFGAGMAAWLLAKVVKELVERGRPQVLLADVILRPAWNGLGFVSGAVVE